MKDELTKVKDKALVVVGAGIVSKSSEARIANLPVIEDSSEEMIDQEMDRLFKSVTGPLRAILHAAGILLGSVDIEWNYHRPCAAEVYDQVRGLEISLEARSKRPESEVV
jgi:hypothetical protein